MRIVTWGRDRIVRGSTGAPTARSLGTTVAVALVIAVVGVLLMPASALGQPVGDGPGAGTTDDGLVSVFVRGLDNAVWMRRGDMPADLADATWSDWQRIGGATTSAPAAISTDGQSMDLFVRGEDNALWTRHNVYYLYPNNWGSWTRLGGSVTSAPAVTFGSGGIADVFVRGADGAVWVCAFNGSYCSAWSTLGGRVTGAPAVATNPDTGVVDVVVRGTDDRVWTCEYDGFSCSSWMSPGGVVTASPSAVHDTFWGTLSGPFSVYVRGQDGAVWRRMRVGADWTDDWITHGGHIASPPAAVDSPDVWLFDYVFARGQDGILWANLRGDWVSLGGKIR